MAAGRHHGSRAVAWSETKGQPSLRALASVRPAAEVKLAMAERMRRCCALYEFNVRSRLAEKELKRRALLDILDFVHATPGVFTREMLPDLARLVEANLFVSRTPPPPQSRVRRRPLAVHGQEKDPASMVASTMPPRAPGAAGTSAASPSTSDVSSAAAAAAAAAATTTTTTSSSSSSSSAASSAAQSQPSSPSSSSGGDDGGGGDDDIVNRIVLDPAWPHLHIVYELLLRFAVSQDATPQEVRRLMGRTFSCRLLGLLRSFDPRERSYVKTIVHRFYMRLKPLRAYLRTQMASELLAVVHEVQHHHPGMRELLEILTSIASGFVLPLRPEHRLLLERVVMPLHAVPWVASFFSELVACVASFIEKEPGLSQAALRRLLAVWPWRDSQKMLLFLNALEELLDLTPPAVFQVVAAPLLDVICRCMKSHSIQVAERALRIWNNQYFMSLVAQQRSVVFPVVYDALQIVLADAGGGSSCSSSSSSSSSSILPWNSTVLSLSSSLLQVLAKMDPVLFGHIREKHRDLAEERRSAQIARAERWKMLLDQAETVRAMSPAPPQMAGLEAAEC